jgi:hypothetical protein
LQSRKMASQNWLHHRHRSYQNGSQTTKLLTTKSLKYSTDRYRNQRVQRARTRRRRSRRRKRLMTRTSQVMRSDPSFLRSSVKMVLSILTWLQLWNRMALMVRQHLPCMTGRRHGPEVLRASGRRTPSFKDANRIHHFMVPADNG